MRLSYNIAFMRRQSRAHARSGHGVCAVAAKVAIAGVAALLVPLSTPALAHGSERGFVLLLPTGYYLVGGTLAVAASFALISLVPAPLIERWAAARLRLGTVSEISPAATSTAAFLLLLFLIATGLHGSRDPLENPLPLTIWSLWWAGVTLLHAVFGNLWVYVNPWSGPYRLMKAVFGARLGRVAYPGWLGYWPAVVLFFAFAWFELVDPAPDDPEKLAIATSLYWCLTFLGMLVFGEGAWRDKAEPFSVFFRLVADLAPLSYRKVAGERVAVALAWPGAALLQRAPMPLSGVLFVLLTLSSVSFDGLSKTFWWLSLGGINPLEFPGRTAVVGRNTLGLIVAFATLAAVYWLAVRLGWILAGMRISVMPALGAIVLSIIPISIAFHVAHYLTALMVNGQYAIVAASDPFGTGLDLFGTRDTHVTTSFLNTYSSVRLIWNLQTAVIVIGHVAGVVLAHALALRHFGGGRSTVASELPLAVMMVLYTLFGLWLLSTPTAG